MTTIKVEPRRMVQDRVNEGQTVAILVSSSDAGIYGIAGIMRGRRRDDVVSSN